MVRLGQHLRSGRTARGAVATSALAILAAFGTPAAAQSWDGSDSSDWFAGANWSGGSAPDGSESVTIDTILPNPTVINGAAADIGTETITIGDVGEGSLDITSGGTLTSGDGYIGRYATGGRGDGTVTVEGVGSSWTSGFLHVGPEGDGVLNLVDGALVEATALYVAAGEGSTGAVTVRGAGSFLNVTNELVAGHSPGDVGGAATVDVLAGGRIDSGGFYLDKIGTTGGVATVSGAGSVWNNTGLTTIGQTTGGSLIIEDGGIFNSNGPTRVANEAGSIASVTVTGAGSAWHIVDELATIGQSGEGSLSILGGGTVTNSEDVNIGNSATSIGSALVSGADSLWQIDGQITIGAAGSGTLRIEDGGVVTVGSTMGVSGLGPGSLTIDGAGSRLSLQQGIFIAFQNEGTLTISNGGLLETSLIGGSNPGDIYNFVGYFPNDDPLVHSYGEAVITGAGSLWTTPGIIIIAGNGSEGELRVENGGSLIVGTQLDVGRGAHVILNEQNEPEIVGEGRLIITGADTTATLNALMVANGGGLGYAIASDGATVTSEFIGVGLGGTFASGIEVNARGGLLITGEGTTWVNDGDHAVDGNVMIAATGETFLRIADGASLATRSVTMAAYETMSPPTEVTTPRTALLIIGGAVDMDGTVGAAEAPGSLTVDEQITFAAIGGTTSTLIFNHTDSNYIFTPVLIADARVANPSQGLIRQVAGTTVLTGASGGFTGLTRIEGGTLDVANVLGGSVQVASGGTLTGAGSVGATTVANGGILSGAAGTDLTLASLVLSETSIVDVALGAPSNAALFDVTGALTLDGQLTVSDAGGFGLGTYRLFDYGGALTNNGLTIASLPAGFNPGDWSIGTGAAGQVNLLVAEGPGEQYWDGANLTPGAVENGRGGSGVWNAANTNWTNQAGTINAPWAEQMAVFAAAGPSTVTIEGAQTVTGLRFLSGSDYSFVAGEEGGLVAASGMVSIVLNESGGDSTSVSIAAPISGNGGIAKSGDGTLILSADNSYAGGTTIAEGTLRIGDGGTSGSVAGNIANDGTLVFDRSDNATFAGTISGSGNLVQAGSGTLILSAASSYSGSTRVNDGTLEVNGSIAASAVTVASGGTLTGAGSVGGTTVANGGILSGAAGTDLTLASLVLSETSIVDVALGAPSNAALFDVTGALTLDGQLAVSDAGGFGLGTYRLFDYGGALTDNGLTIASLPAGFNPGDWSIGTGAAGQIDLLVAEGPGEQYWDGANLTPGAVENGRGGSGVWNAASTNWTNQAGTINAPWAEQKAVFAAAGPSTVTVEGTQSFTGLRFLTGSDYDFVAGEEGALAIGSGLAPVVVEQSGGDQTIVRIAAPIGGSGGIAKSGGGTLILSADNSYTGGTTIAAGTLQLGDGGTSGSVAGNIANDGTLVFDRSDDALFSGTVSGSGSLVQAGSGTLSLSATHSYSGATLVEAGTLNVLGSISASAVTVAEVATLSGVGVVGNATVAGTIAPGGDSAGTLDVAGDYLQLAGSTYDYQPGDLIRVAGTATIEGGLVVAANEAGRRYALGERSAILTAGDGLVLASPGQSATAFSAQAIEGVGLELAAPLSQPFLTLALTHDETAIYLEAVRNGVSFESVGGTINERAAARGADGMAETGALYSALATVGDETAARAGFNLLSGEIHASLKSVLLDESRHVREALLGRLGRADAEGHGLWGHAFGSRGETDGDGNAAALDRSTAGVLIGVDTAVQGQLRVGLAGGYSRSDVDVDARASAAEIDSYHLGLYAGGRWGGTSLKLGGALAWHDVATRRSAGFAGFQDAVQANHDGRGLQLFAEAAHGIAFGEGTVETFAGIAHARLRTLAFTEQGGESALSAGRQSHSTTWSTLGVRGTLPIGAGSQLNAGLAWRHALDGRLARAELAFGGDQPFTVHAAPLDGDSALIDVGASFGLGRGATLAVGYAGAIGSRSGDHGARATIGFRF